MSVIPTDPLAGKPKLELGKTSSEVEGYDSLDTNTKAPKVTITGIELMSSENARAVPGRVQMELPGGLMLDVMPSDRINKEQFAQLLEACGFDTSTPTKKRALEDAVRNFAGYRITSWSSALAFMGGAKGAIFTLDDFKEFEKREHDKQKLQGVGIDEIMAGFSKGVTFQTSIDGDPKNTVKAKFDRDIFDKIPLYDPTKPPSEKNPSITKAQADILLDATKDADSEDDIKEEIKRSIDILKKSTAKPHNPKMFETLLLSFVVDMQKNALTADFADGNMRYAMLKHLGNELKTELGPEKSAKVYALGMAYLGPDGAKLMETDGSYHWIGDGGDEEKKMRKFVETGDVFSLTATKEQGGNDWNLSHNGYKDMFDDAFNSDNSWNMLRDNGNVLKKNGKLTDKLSTNDQPIHTRLPSYLQPSEPPKP